MNRNSLFFIFLIKGGGGVRPKLEKNIFFSEPFPQQALNNYLVSYKQYNFVQDFLDLKVRYPKNNI